MQDGLFKSDDGCALRFFIEPEQNQAASDRCGRAIFDECLYVEVIAPASRESAPVFLLERTYAEEVGIAEPQRSHKYEQYKKQIDAYRNGSDNIDVRGTPLSAWPRMTVGLVAAAHHAGIFTVEALALVPDGRLSAFGPGARALRDQANAFVAAASGNAPTEALAAENVQLRADVERLTADVQALSTRLTAQEAPAKADPLAPALTPPTGAPAAPTTGKPKTVQPGGGNII